MTRTTSAWPEEVAGRTVLVVDDHRTVGQLLQMALDLEGGLRCIGVAAGLPEAREMVDREPPDVVVADIQFAGSTEDGIDFAAEMSKRHPATLVVLLTGATRPIDLTRVVASGACALLAKDGDLASLLTTIARAAPGQLHIDPRLLHELARPPARLAVGLTDREAEVLGLLAEGVDAQTTARRLGIRISTCRGHIKSVFHKLDVHSQLEAVSVARRLGLLDEGNAR